MCERRVTPGGGRIFACHGRDHVSHSEESATEREKFTLSNRACFAPCRESLAGEPCPCNPRIVLRSTPWDEEPVECIDYGPYTGHVPEFPEELGRDPLEIVVCPLGSECLGHGPTCLGVAEVLNSVTIDS